MLPPVSASLFSCGALRDAALMLVVAEGFVVIGLVFGPREAWIAEEQLVVVLAAVEVELLHALHGFAHDGRRTDRLKDGSVRTDVPGSDFDDVAGLEERLHLGVVLLLHLRHVPALALPVPANLA